MFSKFALVSLLSVDCGQVSFVAVSVNQVRDDCGREPIRWG